MDLAIRMTGGSNTANIVLLLNQDNTWSSLVVSYLITSRSDFYVGHFIAGTLSHIQTLTSPVLSAAPSPSLTASLTGLQTATSGRPSLSSLVSGPQPLELFR